MKKLITITLLLAAMKASAQEPRKNLEFTNFGYAVTGIGVGSALAFTLLNDNKPNLMLYGASGFVALVGIGIIIESHLSSPKFRNQTRVTAARNGIGVMLEF